MTDRHAGFVVTLAQDVREDDAEAVIAALRMVKGVVDVQPVAGDYGLHIAEVRAEERWRERIIGLLERRD